MCVHHVHALIVGAEYLEGGGVRFEQCRRNGLYTKTGYRNWKAGSCVVCFGLLPSCTAVHGELFMLMIMLMLMNQAPDLRVRSNSYTAFVLHSQQGCLSGC